jgi:hypothetical protein
VTADEAIADLCESVRKIDAIQAEHPVRAAHAALAAALKAAALAVAAPNLGESSEQHLLTGAMVLLNLAVRALGLEAIYTCQVTTAASNTSSGRGKSPRG